MYGIGILKGLSVTLSHFVQTFVDDIQWFGRRNGLETFQVKQSLKGKGMFTVQYPEEKIAVPERFRFVPFLVVYNADDPEYPNKDWCTSCGICAKVCPPQCIWIVRGTNPETGRPKPEPEAFYIDIDICMNCGYCAEYCPFDAIKMDHDYELASYDRTTHHVYDHEKLSKPVSYWQAIAPTTADEEMLARGGYDQTDIQKARKKAGLPASRTGPVSDKPVEAPAAVPVAVPASAAATGEATAAVAAPLAAAPGAPAPATGAAPAAGATHTADGKVIVRRRGATPAAATPAGGAAPGAPAAPATPPPVAAAPATAAPAAPPPVTATAPEPAAPAAPAAPATSGEAPKSGPKPRDPNAPVVVVRRRNNPPPKKD